ncbi:unnamed protein product, partial [Ectocarpus sp. 12 AP-2014]
MFRFLLNLPLLTAADRKSSKSTATLVRRTIVIHSCKPSPFSAVCFACASDLAARSIFSFAEGRPFHLPQSLQLFAYQFLFLYTSIAYNAAMQFRARFPTVA